MTFSRWLSICALVGASLGAPFLLACSTSSNGFGATPGGVQDMGLARELIASGVVPPASAFVVEGMFAEHDLPVGGGACERTLCLRGAGGLAPAADGTDAAWVEVGLSSSIDPASFERAPQTLVLVVDVSGSMAWNGGEETPGEIARTLLSAIADELAPTDEVALVTYGSAVTEVLSLAPFDAARVEAAIAGLREAGSTNLEAGLARGIAIADGARSRSADRAVRLFLFTDEQPNVGATTPAAFGSMVREAADRDIGITVFGVGRGLGQEVFLAMSHLRGGNGFSLFHQDDVPALIEDSWPWMLVPIAYDLTVEPTLPAGALVHTGHGFPDAEAGAAPVLEASSVFLSRRRGALLLELRGESLAGGAVALDLAYTEPSGAPITEHVEVTLPVTSPSFAQPGVAHATALALLVEGMRDAAEVYGAQPRQAIETLSAARARFAADLERTPSTALDAELLLADDLLALMESGAGQRGY